MEMDYIILNHDLHNLKSLHTSLRSVYLIGREYWANSS